MPLGHSTRVVIAITLAILVGASVTYAAQGAGLLYRIASLMRESPSEAAVDAALGSLTQRAVRDRTGVYRYATTLDSLPCDVIPGYGIITNSLDFILVDSRVEGEWIDEMQWERDGIRQELVTIYGKPTSEADGQRALNASRTDLKQSYWIGDFGSCVLVIEGIECGGPQVSVLFLSQAAFDSLNRADKELGTDPRDRPRVWTEWARARFYPRLALPDSLRPPQSAESDHNQTGDSIIVDEMPVVVRHEFPKFPRRAADEWVTGTVWVAALVGVDGKVIDARILRRSGKCVGFEQAALDAAYKNEYVPAKLNGEPLPVWVSYDLKFELKR